MIENLPITLDVDVDRIHVGDIVKKRDGSTSFVVAPSYIDAGADRPILSLSWFHPDREDATVAALRSTKGKTGIVRSLPFWFSNLLPEGALRALVDSEIGTGHFGDYDVLKHVGGDLPGAVRAGLSDETAMPSTGRIHFSLAGVQLKFVAELAGDRLTFPAAGRGGRYIVKAAAEKYPDLVELENAAMRLIAAIGVDVAPTSLVSRDDLGDVPAEFLQHGENVLVSTRFDRDPNGTRVHIEDFAQIGELVGDLKYTRGNYSLVLGLAKRFSTDPDADIDQVIRRSVANVLIGNGDAHLKNWSFVLHEGHRRLSPTYDVVPTRLYGDEGLGISLNGAKRFNSVRLADIVRTAGYVKVPEETTLSIVRDVVEQALDLWPPMLNEMALKESSKQALLVNMQTLPLVADLQASAAPTP